jgi:formate dehydrogenase accessory protein FdhE
MTISDQDLQVLHTLAGAIEQHQELAQLLEFYRDLYQVQFEAKAQLPAPALRNERAVSWRLEGGIPQLTFDQLAIDPASFAQLVASIVEVLLRHNPAWQFQYQEVEPPELVAMAREVFENWETLTAPKAAAGIGLEDSWTGQPLALAVGFALAPYLQRASEVILPQLALSQWSQDHCPVCGGRPNLALFESEQGARQLVCSRCNCLWRYPRVGCPFCGSKEKQFYYPSEDGVYRLYVCPACNRYLKTMDLRGVYREVNPVVERLLTVGMDLAAAQEGYGS